MHQWWKTHTVSGSFINEKPSVCSKQLYLHGKLTTKPLCTCVDDVSTFSAEDSSKSCSNPPETRFETNLAKKTALERRWNGAGTALKRRWNGAETRPKNGAGMALERCWNCAERGKLGILSFVVFLPDFGEICPATKTKFSMDGVPALDGLFLVKIKRFLAFLWLRLLKFSDF